MKYEISLILKVAQKQVSMGWVRKESLDKTNGRFIFANKPNQSMAELLARELRGTIVKREALFAFTYH